MTHCNLSEILFVWIVVGMASLIVSPVPVPFVNLDSGKAQSVCQVLDMFLRPVGVALILSL